MVVDVVTYGRWGVYRWPIRPDSALGPNAISIGPPELLWESRSDNEFTCASWLPDHRTLAIIDNARAQVMLVDSRSPHPARSRAIALDAGENHSMTSVAVSPDGHWLAVGGWYQPAATVWDLRRRRLERILRPRDAKGNTKFFVGFSPDGRWLVSSTYPDASAAAYHFWRVGTWELDRRIESRAGRGAHDVYRRRPADGSVHRPPDRARRRRNRPGADAAADVLRPTPLNFSPDGTKLVVGTDRNTVLVWDLRRIRDQLTPIGLDWDAPPYPTAPVASEAEGPLPPLPMRSCGRGDRQPGSASPRSRPYELPARCRPGRRRCPDPSRLAPDQPVEAGRGNH